VEAWAIELGNRLAGSSSLRLRPVARRPPGAPASRTEKISIGVRTDSAVWFRWDRRRSCRGEPSTVPPTRSASARIRSGSGGGRAAPRDRHPPSIGRSDAVAQPHDPRSQRRQVRACPEIHGNPLTRESEPTRVALEHRAEVADDAPWIECRRHSDDPIHDRTPHDRRSVPELSEKLPDLADRGRAPPGGRDKKIEVTDLMRSGRGHHDDLSSNQDASDAGDASWSGCGATGRPFAPPMSVKRSGRMARVARDRLDEAGSGRCPGPS
jgi:hypothetical protein